MSTALVPSGGSSGSNAFAQQGTVDWTALSGSTVNFSVEILARHSKAGVEPITVAMGQAIFSGFNLDPEGQKRFSDALSRLKAFSSYGSVLWLGFGVKHIVRTLSETEQGATCVAICACLSVSYDKFFCSKVLKALADQQRVPNSLMPSLSQWMALVQICSGTVLGPRFPQLVEVYSRLTQSCGGHIGEFNLQEATSTATLARALSDLAKVSSGSLRSITFVGGGDCGWLAALAQWLLSLRVDILDADGSVLYSSKTSVGPSYYPQVIIVRQSGDSRSNTMVLKKAVTVSPGKPCFIIGTPDFDRQFHLFSAGRSEWSTILRNTFGACFDALLRPEVIQNFARLLCYGFVLLSRIPDPTRFYPFGDGSTTIAEMQLSLLSFAAKRLPELILVCQVGKQMISCQNIPYVGTSRTVEEFTHHCSCAQCGSAMDSSPPQNFETSNAICLKRTALTIFEYIWTLSWLDIDENIYPSVAGLALMSKSQNPILLLHSAQLTTTTMAIRRRIFENPLFPMIVALFTGQPKLSQQTDSTLSARSKGGVCVYLPSLKNPATSPQEQLRAIVVAGHIEWDTKLYTRVIDGVTRTSSVVPDGLASTVVQTYGANLELELVVEETFTSDALVANLWILSKLLHSPQHISYHADHVATPSHSSREHDFGASSIRSAIISSVASYDCMSEVVEVHAVSSNGPIFWTGHCSKAAESLWVDGSSNKCYGPSTKEWVLISSSQCCQEIVRGPYHLLYSVICSQGQGHKMLLTAEACLVCSLKRHRGDYPIQGGPKGSRDLQCVTMHSFLNSEPSSRVLLTSAKFLPRLNTAQSLFKLDFTISDDDQGSSSSVGQSGAVRHWKPRPERDAGSSKPNERPRPKSM
ncbi:hypothetical protein V498_08536 [Pseudogymnoascus sp. VKM F-4517 (FW-2822)]|nr:hypothetical protein V498_08536 [Pseudogymnoascus sp. VKM F-4517 (FW-2822)]